MSVAELEGVWKTYPMGEEPVHALRDVSFALGEGELMAITGPSGSGKSTLLNLLGCLDQPTQGRYLLGNRDVAQLDDNELSGIRAGEIGFIFQSYNLIPQLNVIENIEIPLYYLGVSESESFERAREMAHRVGLSHRLKHLPVKLSGGERQRVGIARALVSRPLFVLADEPTGNLDTKTGARILGLIREIHQDGVAMIIVTHDASVADQAQRVMHLVDGQMTEVRRDE
jgi:putative ABC transport system ATP-binding protein